MNIPTRRELLVLLRRSVDVAKAPVLTEVTVAPNVAHILGFYMRATGLAEGVNALLRANLPHEAAVLTRPLMEERLKLEELAASNPAERGGLVVDWQFKSFTETLRLFNEQAQAAGLGSDEDRETALREIERRRLALRRYAQERGFVRRPFLAPSTALRRFAEPGDYWTYMLTQEMVHGSDAANTFRRTRRPDGLYQIAVHSSPLALVAGVVDVAGRCVLRSCVAIATIMDWPVPPEVDSLLKEFADLEDRLGPTGENLVSGDET